MHRFVSSLLSVTLFLSVSGRGQEPDSRTDDSEQPEGARNLPAGLPVKLDISRRELKNFLTDETALIPFAGSTDSVSDFPGAFTVGSPQARFAVIWSPTSCRIVGVLDLSPTGDSDTTPYRLVASGVAPTSSIAGSSDPPAYFGMRMKRGRPEFLYTHGSNAIAESIWLEDEGTILKQKFSLRKGVDGLRLTFPSEWVPIIQPSAGVWKENVLSVSGEDIREVTLLYRLETPIEDSKEEEAE